VKLIFCILILINTTSFSQRRNLVITVNLLNEFRGELKNSDITIFFRDGNERVQGFLDSNNRAEFKDLLSDTLKLLMYSEVKIKDSIATKTLNAFYSVAINKNGQTVLDLTFPKDCEFNRHTFNDTCPVCKKNDRVVPIVYGLLSPPSLFKGRIFEDFIPGGCVISDCDPTWYCKIDELSF
jgi:hypothetical protein